MPNKHVSLLALPGIPAVTPGDDIAALILDALSRAGETLHDGDVLVVSSKIISKAEGRFVDLRAVVPSDHALEVAAFTRKDPRLVELVLRESEGISRTAPNILLVRHKLGFTSANAGIDMSNTGSLGEDVALLLPADPDASAAALHQLLTAHFQTRIGVIISDTHGRPFRFGNLNVAIGLCGLPALIDQRGQHDLFGRELHATLTPLADELAAAAGLISGQADEGQPVVLIRGVEWQASPHTARDLIRPAEGDLYR